MFDVGEEIVCIDVSPTNVFGIPELVMGQHYFVEWVGPFTWQNQEMIGVHLRGITYRTMPFRTTRFVPLRKTDISELEKLLVPVEKRELIDA